MYIHVMRMSVQTHSYTHTHAPAHMYMYTYICTHTHNILHTSTPPLAKWIPIFGTKLGKELAALLNLQPRPSSVSFAAGATAWEAGQPVRRGAHVGAMGKSAAWQRQITWEVKNVFQSLKNHGGFETRLKQSWSKQTRRMCNFVIATHVPCLGFPQTTWNCLLFV